MRERVCAFVLILTHGYEYQKHLKRWKLLEWVSRRHFFLSLYYVGTYIKVRWSVMKRHNESCLRSIKRKTFHRWNFDIKSDLDNKKDHDLEVELSAIYCQTITWKRFDQKHLEHHKAYFDVHTSERQPTRSVLLPLLTILQLDKCLCLFISLIFYDDVVRCFISSDLILSSIM